MPEAAMSSAAEMLRDTERRRLRSLVKIDLVTAAALHADDYQLITPRGYALSKQDYLGDIASGQLSYQVFEPISEIAVRAGDRTAALRYRARITVSSGGPAATITCWHTDYYELRDVGWQAVWSQATIISFDAARDQPSPSDDDSAPRPPGLGLKAG